MRTSEPIGYTPRLWTKALNTFTSSWPAWAHAVMRETESAGSQPFLYGRFEVIAS